MQGYVPPEGVEIGKMKNEDTPEISNQELLKAIRDLEKRVEKLEHEQSDVRGQLYFAAGGR